MNNRVDEQPRRGWLKNGNTPGNPDSAPRCEAKTRRGTACRSPAMANGRCRMHGGASTGPRTQEGLARSKRARWKHGFYSAAEPGGVKATMVIVGARSLAVHGVDPWVFSSVEDSTHQSTGSGPEKTGLRRGFARFLSRTGCLPIAPPNHERGNRSAHAA
jgi:hypothetical protein